MVKCGNAQTGMLTIVRSGRASASRRASRDGELVRPHDSLRAHDRCPCSASAPAIRSSTPSAKPAMSAVHGSSPVRDGQQADRGHQVPASPCARGRTTPARAARAAGRRVGPPPAGLRCARAASAIAVAAILRTGWASVVSGGSISSAQSGSSTATSARSSGTRTRARRIARSAPSAHQVVGDHERRGRGVVSRAASRRPPRLRRCGSRRPTANGIRPAARMAARVPLEPLRSGLDVEAAADEGDPRVAEPEQMLRGAPHALDVVAHDGVDAGILDLPVEGDDGDPEREQRVDARAGRVRGDTIAAITRFVGEHLEVCPLLLRRLVRVAEQHSIAGRVGRVLDRPALPR